MPSTFFNADEIKNVHCNSAMALERSKLARESKKFNLELEQLRIHDSASNAVLPNTAAADDLGLIIGTIGTAGFTVQTSDAKVSTTTQKAAFRFSLPPEYDDGEAIAIVLHAGMMTTISDGTATIDISAYSKNEADGTHGADLCTTAAVTINSLTAAAKSFTVDPTGLVNGDELTVLITIAITDGATGTAVVGRITKVHCLLDIKG